MELDKAIQLKVYSNVILSMVAQGMYTPLEGRQRIEELFAEFAPPLTIVDKQKQYMEKNDKDAADWRKANKVTKEVKDGR